MSISESKYIDNFLSENLYNSLYKYVNDITWKYGWRSNKSVGHAHWNYEIAPASFDNGLDISQKLPEVILDIWNYMKEKYFSNYIPIRCYANSHTYGTEGYPHVDSLRDQDLTVVIYMNREWKKEWGGETLIYGDLDSIEIASLPKSNRALIFKGNRLHCARGLSRICPEQRKVFVFKLAEINADTMRDSLQIFLESVGASDKKHHFGSLSSHLLSVYDLLKLKKQNQNICLAGGSHSILGTNAFKDACLKPEEKNKLISFFGEEPTKYVELFSIINRPNTLEKALANKSTTVELTTSGTISLSKEEIQNLSMIEAANLADQQILGRYKNLQQLWNSF